MLIAYRKNMPQPHKTANHKHKKHTTLTEPRIPNKPTQHPPKRTQQKKNHNKPTTNKPPCSGFVFLYSVSAKGVKNVSYSFIQLVFGILALDKPLSPNFRAFFAALNRTAVKVFAREGTGFSSATEVCSATICN
jgi:hypothetical protein